MAKPLYKNRIRTTHKEQIEVIQKVQADSLRQLFIETTKDNRNENVIFRVKNDIRENAKLLSELGLGTSNHFRN